MRVARALRGMTALALAAGVVLLPQLPAASSASTDLYAQAQDGPWRTAQGSIWLAQSFTTSAASDTLTVSVRIRNANESNSSATTSAYSLNLRTAAMNGQPDTSTAGSWIVENRSVAPWGDGWETFTVATPLAANTRYFIVMTGSNNGTLGWKFASSDSITTSVTPVPTFSAVRSQDAGASWQNLTSSGFAMVVTVTSGSTSPPPPPSTPPATEPPSTPTEPPATPTPEPEPTRTPEPPPVAPLIPTTLPSVTVVAESITCDVGGSSAQPSRVTATLIVNGERLPTREVDPSSTVVTWPIENAWRGGTVACEVFMVAGSAVSTAQTVASPIPPATSLSPTPAPSTTSTVDPTPSALATPTQSPEPTTTRAVEPTRSVALATTTPQPAPTRSASPASAAPTTTLSDSPAPSSTQTPPSVSDRVHPPTSSPRGGVSLPPGGLFAEVVPSSTLEMSLGLVTGARAASRQILIVGDGLTPGAPVALTIYSTPRILGTAVVDNDGSITVAISIPSDLESGEHTLVASSTDVDGSLVQSMAAFTLDDDGVVTALAPPAQVTGIAPGGSEISRALRYEAPVYNVTNHPVTTAAVATTAAVFLGLAGAAGMSGAGSGMARGSASSPSDSGSASGERRSRGKLASVVTKKLKRLDQDAAGAGDASRTWRLPWTHLTDRWAINLIERSQPYSALLPRVFVDGAWARAIGGSSAMLLWLAGAVLGVVYLTASGATLAPVSLIVVALIVGVSVLDSASGFWAWLVIATGALVTGNVRDLGDVRLLLGLGVLFVSVALLAHAIRPLRRRPARTPVDRFDRVADYVMPPVFLALASGSMLKALNGLSGLELIDKSNISLVQWTVVGAFLLRMAMEDAATYLYPQRFEAVQPRKLRSPSARVQGSAALAKFLLTVLIAAPFFGLGWSTWLAAALLTLPVFLKIWEDDLPNSMLLHRWYPRGVLRFALMLVVGIYMSAWLLGSDPGDDTVRATYVWLLLPGIVAGLIELVARNGFEWTNTWAKRLAGAPVWAFAALVSLGVVTLAS